MPNTLIESMASSNFNGTGIYRLYFWITGSFELYCTFNTISLFSYETISRIIADLGGNIVSIHHDRYDLNIDITSCILDIRVETRDQAHIDEIVSALLANGIRITNL